MSHLNRAALAAAVACLLAPSAALADSPTSTAAEIARAVAAEPSAPATTAISSVPLPQRGGAAVTTPGGVTLTLPATGRPSVVGDTAVYASAESPAAQVALQATNLGVRALINIDSAAAPERYAFTLGGGVTRLAPQADGSVLALGARGNVVSVVDRAWARDARGAAVPTSYEIRGTTLTQVVRHRRGGFTYGITADPRVSIGATTGVVYLNRTETRQVGQGGAWVIAGGVALALAPQTAGVGTIAALAVGAALGSVGSKLIDSQLAKGQCIKISVPWLSFGTVAKIGWYACTA